MMHVGGVVFVEGFALHTSQSHEERINSMAAHTSGTGTLDVAAVEDLGGIGAASARHRRGIGAASARHRRGIGAASARHRRGIGAASA
jgi:hypothetical protein